MAAAVSLRDDFEGPGLRRLARATKDAAQARRLLALAEVCDGGSRSDAARVSLIFTACLAAQRRWVERFKTARYPPRFGCELDPEPEVRPRKPPVPRPPSV
jgi:hypothetical protein